MNKFQRERADFFKAYQFSAERKRQVLQQVHKKKPRPKWGWVLASVAAIFLLFLSINSLNNTEQTMRAAYTEQSAFAAFAEMYHGADEEMELIDVQLPYASLGDALIIARDTNSEYDFVRVQHMQFVGEEWQFLEASNAFPIEQSEYPVYWQVLKDEMVQLAAGIVYDDTVDTVYIGQQRAQWFELEKGVRFWIGERLTEGSPIFYERDGQRERIAAYGMVRVIDEIPFIEVLGDEMVVKLSDDAMEKGNRDYTKYPIVINPYHYATEPYQDGDVVLVEANGQQHMTRIVTAQNYHMTVKEGTIVLNDTVFDVEYTWAHFNGDNTIYTAEQHDYGVVQPDEVFVMPDNWASDGVRGRVKKDAIIGKVIGYSKNDLVAPWTAEEKKLYAAFAKAHDDNVLKGATPQQILRLQRYAQYVEDYETMYALYAKESMRKTYDDWRATASLSDTKQQLIYEATLAEEMTFNEETSNLETPSRKPFTFKMIEQNGVWKVVYSTIKTIYQ